MRHTALIFVSLILLPLPVLAWEFSPDPICTLSYQSDEADVTVTFDVSIPQYALSITLRDATWDDALTFQLGFIGPRSNLIGTTQHTLSADGATLTVRDSGFGNVLDGLQFNPGAVAASGATSLRLDLSGAAPAVEAFRACPSDPPATS